MFTNDSKGHTLLNYLPMTKGYTEVKEVEECISFPFVRLR